MRAKSILRPQEAELTTTKRLPEIPLDLLELLEATYPDRCPTADTSHEEFLATASKVELVRTLRALYERQTKQ